MKLVIYFIIFALVILVMSAKGCTDGPKTTELLKAQGFTNITITGYDFFNCAKDDMQHTGFIATSPTGVSMSGTACAGFFKGTTIRFN